MGWHPAQPFWSGAPLKDPDRYTVCGNYSHSFVLARSSSTRPRTRPAPAHTRKAASQVQNCLQAARCALERCARRRSPLFCAQKHQCRNRLTAQRRLRREERIEDEKKRLATALPAPCERACCTLACSTTRAPKSPNACAFACALRERRAALQKCCLSCNFCHLGFVACAAVTCPHLLIEGQNAKTFGFQLLCVAGVGRGASVTASSGENESER